MVRILTVSDKVVPQLYGEHARDVVGEVDLILACGDLPYYYLDFLATTLQVPFYYVFGNHPMGAHLRWPGKRPIPKGANLHGRVVHHRGLLIAGLEGSRRYRPGARYQYTEGEMALQCLRLVPRLLWNRLVHGRYLDILVTHAPPRHIHDAEDPAHRGFTCFRWFMRIFRPRYLIHGHKHVYRRDEPTRTRFYDTMVINTYPYRILTLSPEEEPLPDRTRPSGWRFSSLPAILRTLGRQWVEKVLTRVFPAGGGKGRSQEGEKEAT